MSHPKIQHYVPRFLLANFERTGLEQIYVFDKKSGKTYPTNIKRAAAENGFYDIPLEEGTITIEPWLSTIENDAADVIRRLVATPNLFLLSEADRASIAAFISLQMVRGPAHRSLIKQAAQGALSFAKRAFPKAEIQDNLYIPDETRLKMISIRSIEESPKHVPVLLDKTWLLFSVPIGSAFYVSDNPVVLGNSQAKKAGIFSGLGLLCRGVEIFIPISSQLILALYCPTYEASWRITAAQRTVLKSAGLYEIPKSIEHSERMFEKCLIGLRTRRPIATDSDLLEHHNSMQVVNSERFLFSTSDDFSLARQMIAKFPELQEGPKIQIS